MIYELYGYRYLIDETFFDNDDHIMAQLAHFQSPKPDEWWDQSQGSAAKKGGEGRGSLRVSGQSVQTASEILISSKDHNANN